MRYVAWHGCPAACAAAALMLFVLAPVAFGQDGESDGASTSEGVGPRARRRYRPLQVVALSIFGSGKEEPFTPLLLRNFFTDGWDEPWIAPPEDSDMPRRQGWVNAPDGLFFRNLVWTYENTADIPGDRSANLGLFQFQSPLSRRSWITLDVPYVTTLSAPQGGASFGDFNVGTRVMLRETRRLSIIAGLAARTPTGQLSTGTGLARLDPNLQFWAHLAGRWSMRGGIGPDVPLNHFDVLPTNLLTNVAIGETITGHDVPIFPLTQPHPYGNRLTFFFVKGF